MVIMLDVLILGLLVFNVLETTMAAKLNVTDLFS